MTHLEAWEVEAPTPRLHFPIHPSELAQLTPSPDMSRDLINPRAFERCNKQTTIFPCHQMPTDENIPPSSSRQCSQSKCKITLPDGYKWKSCQGCREKDKLAKRQKRRHEDEDNIPRKRLTPTITKPAALGSSAERGGPQFDVTDKSDCGSDNSNTVRINNHSIATLTFQNRM